MDSFPVDCHNCFSHKRQFYVFLECKHFMCLSCCLCLADFQNLTIRCCHKNTKMSEELASVMFQQVNSRKMFKDSQIHNQQSMIKDIMQIQTSNKILNAKINFIEKPFQQTNSTYYDENKMEQSKIVHTFKIIEQNAHKDTVLQTNNTHQNEKIQRRSYLNQKTALSEVKPLQIQLSEQRQMQSPTFKQISQPYQSQKVRNSQQEQKKQNYLCWKNYDTTKDRILAKLNYHQQKMNSLIRQQHY